MQIVPPTLLDPKAPLPHLTGQKGDQGDPGNPGPGGVPGQRVSQELLDIILYEAAIASQKGINCLAEITVQLSLNEFHHQASQL